MTEKEKDEYILSLERKVQELQYLNLEKKYDVSTILKIQEEFLMEKYSDKDTLLSQNEWLTDEVNRLSRVIAFNNQYINYLLNSFWWKITVPFRIVTRKIRKLGEKSDISIEFAQNRKDDKENVPLDVTISVIIFTYNAGEEFSIQLENIKNQKLLNKVEIVVIDKGSTDNTINIAKKFGATVIKADSPKVINDDIYIYGLSRTFGEYIAIIDQNNVIDSVYWLYQAIVPLVHNQSSITAFFRDDYEDKIIELKNSSVYQELKSRIGTIASKQVIFFPESRDKIQYINPSIMDMTCAIVKKND